MASLMNIPLEEALRQIASWLEDCDDLLALNPHRELPMPPFRLDEAWVVVRLGANRVPTDSPSPARIADEAAMAQAAARKAH
jgi:hypothetical protein